MKICFSGIPAIQEKRTAPSRFAKIRLLFKNTGKLLRNLQYNDQGRINSEILAAQNDFNTEEQNEIAKQGEFVYDILKELLEIDVFEKKTCW